MAVGEVTPTALIETIDIGGLAVSPDGRWLAFQTRQADARANRYTVTWHVVPTDLSAPPHVVGDGGMPLWTDAGTPLSEPPIWLPDSSAFLFRALVGDTVGLWRASPAASARAAVVQDAADIRSFAVDPASGQIRYKVGATRVAIMTAEEREYAQGIRVDATVDLAQAAYRGAIINGRRATQRLSGRWFARQGLLGDTPDREIVLPLPNVTARAKAARTAGSHSGGSPENRHAAIEGGSEGRCVAVAGVDQTRNREHRTVRRCFAGRVASTAWWPTRNALLVILQDEGFAQTLIDWSPVSGRSTTLASAAGLLAGSERPSSPCALGIDVAFCVAASAGEPPRLVRIDRHGRTPRTIYAPNRTVMSGYTGSVEGIVWRDRHGVAFSGQLFLPRNARNAPLFVTYYRCPGFVRGGLGDEWPLATLADRGIAALCIDKPVERPDAVRAQPRYEQALSGVTAIIERLGADGTIDRTRVGMGGLSFGSEVAMWTAVHSRLLRAVSIASLQLEPAYYWMNGVEGRDNHAQLRKTWGLGAPDETPDQWRLMAPALNIDRLDAPILMQLPEQEARTSMELFARLTQSPTPAELYVFADEPHILMQPAHRLAAYERNLDWFGFWLQGRTDPSPAKAEQYHRWQALADRWHARQEAQDRAQRSMPTSSSSLK